MEAVTFTFRFTVGLLFLLLAQADSILISPTLINHYFYQSQYYIYQAAEFDNPEANYLIYQQTNNKKWLKKAASLNHLASVFQWYLIQKNAGHISQDVWLQQAINLGHKSAALIKLGLIVKDKNWQQAINFEQENLTLLKTLEGDLLAEYQQLTSLLTLSQANDVLVNKALTASTINQVTKGHELLCEMTIQTLVESQSLLTKALQLQHSFETSKLNMLSVCFLPPKVMPQLQVICEPDHYGRAECQLEKLAEGLTDPSFVAPSFYNHLVVMLEKGEANTRGGLMYLDKEDNAQVFIHELAHWLGYADEYQLKEKQQALRCTVTKPKWVSHNIFVSSETISELEVEKIAGIKLYPTNTCKGTVFNAYKILPELSFMEYLDLPLSDEYAQHIKKNVDYKSITPVSKNFWLYYLKKQKAAVEINTKDIANKQYLMWLNIAAKQSYTPAMTLLAQYLIEQDKYTQAFSMLFDSAKLNNVNAQLLLGHGYIEGRWLTQDTIKSAYWYQQAAKQNDPYGLYFMGKCYEMGWGCELSLPKAVSYYQQAKRLDSQLATKRLQKLLIR